MDNQKPYNMEPNIAGVVSYLPLVGLVILFSEKENKFIKFHAYQALLFWIAVIAGTGILEVLSSFILGLLLIPLFNLATLGIWLLLMWKAYNNEEYMLPLLGEIAKKEAYK